jgi:hypothetical protein
MIKLKKKLIKKNKIESIELTYQTKLTWQIGNPRHESMINQ